MARKINAVSPNESRLNEIFADPERRNTSNFRGISYEDERRADANEIYESGTKWVNEQLETGGGSVTPEQVEDAVEATMLEKGIIKRSLLPEGYPYTGFTEIFPEQSLAFTTEEFDYQAPLPHPIGLVAGGTYEVSWNGTVYSCVAESAEMEGVPIVIMGDLGAMSGEPTGTHPFVVMELPPDMAAEIGGVYGVIMPLDGSESAVVSIRGGGNIPIDRKWLPEGYPYIVEAGVTVVEERQYTTEDGWITLPPFNRNVTYRVTWNGVEYSVAPVALPDNNLGADVCWGNAAIFGLEETEEPFVIIIREGVTAVYVQDESAAVTLKIVTEKSYIPIDKRYLPGNGNLNIANGENIGSLIGISAKEESDTYKLGSDSMAVGNNSEASGYNSLAFGDQVKANSDFSAAFGSRTTSTGGCSVATGSFSVASGAFSFAAGMSAIAEGHSAHAAGQEVKASGYSAHAEGRETTAAGDYSHAEGHRTIAASKYQHVQGRMNVADVDEKYAHIVGNGAPLGDENTRSNAHTLDWEGNAWFAGSVEGTALILTSPGGKRFKVTVSDGGSLAATEITQ